MDIPTEKAADRRTRRLVPLPPATSVSKRRSLFVWTMCCIVAGLVFLAYAFASLAAGRGEFVMPLDDVYIHFQYAKQLASGQPFRYNPGLPPTSGATSFVYPFVLGGGYLLGFRELNLGLWAMLVGALALAASIYLVYLLAKALDAPDWIAILVGGMFALSGPVSWHFMSGMETGLTMLFTLATLYTFITQHTRGFVFVSTLLALIRPEGGVFSLIAVVLFASVSPLPRKSKLLFLLPLVAIGVQPAVNWLLTGSPIATGNQAKSLFGLIPSDGNVITGRIAENFVRMCCEMLFPEDWLTPLTTGVIGLGIFSIIGLIRLPNRGKKRVVLLLVLWFLAGTVTVSTLDTAFWHFKRYQMPLIILLFPLASVGLLAVFSTMRRLGQLGRGENTTLPIGELTVVSATLMLLLTAFIVFSFIGAGLMNFTYMRWYAANVNSIYQQPLLMARWLKVNTPNDVTVAVHDVGLMRYVGERTTIDLVGLTTPNAADYWRNGPGAVAEFLMKVQPDYVAAYTDTRGLSYLADTGIYGELLTGFTAEYEENSNVALAGHFQGIYKVNWDEIVRVLPSIQPAIYENYVSKVGGKLPIDTLDVADIADENQAGYRWFNRETLPGFPTEVHEFEYIDCLDEVVSRYGDCKVLDGGRRINGEEQFELTFSVDSGSQFAVLLVTRLHPMNAGTFDVYANGHFVATHWIPSIPGQWLEVATQIPSDYYSNPMQIRIVPDIPNGYYMPYAHTAYYMAQVELADSTGATNFQNGAIQLVGHNLEYVAGAPRISVNLTWQTPGNAQGDYLVFVHLYDDISQPPTAQTDIRPGNGTLPPGNWLPGVIRDTIVVDVEDVPSGTYQVAIGMYDPLTNERLKPDNGGDEFGRLFIGKVEIKGGDEH